MPAYSATLLLLFCGYMLFVQELPKCLSHTSLENEIQRLVLFSRFIRMNLDINYENVKPCIPFVEVYFVQTFPCNLFLFICIEGKNYGKHEKDLRLYAVLKPAP
jgi:hypothetical protein